MAEFEILCVTMHQTDFSKIEEMNIHSDVVFANQCEYTSYEEIEFDGHSAKMISTQTKGVGVNRNIALMYANADICLFADDDVVYKDNMVELITSEFHNHPDADVIIFHFDTNDDKRSQRKYPKTKKCGKFMPMPWGAIRIAARLDSIKRANVCFTTLFGGGTIFPSGEDSIFLTDLRKAGMIFYVSKETIGEVSFDTSTWFTGFDEKFYYGKGAFYQAARPAFKYFWMLYMAWRTSNESDMKFFDKLKWMSYGSKGYKKMISYDEYVDHTI